MAEAAVGAVDLGLVDGEVAVLFGEAFVAEEFYAFVEAHDVEPALHFVEEFEAAFFEEDVECCGE